MLENALRKGADKIIKANHGAWKTLSTGEKVIKVIIQLVLWAIKITLVLSVGAVVAGIALGVWFAFILIDGAAGAIDGQIDRSNAYKERRRW